MSKKRLNTGNVAADNNAGINSDLSESQYASLIEKLIAEDESESFDAIDFSVSATENINNALFIFSVADTEKSMASKLSDSSSAINFSIKEAY